MRVTSGNVFRLLTSVFASLGVAYLVANHDRIGMKGTFIPLASVGLCILASCVTAFLVQRLWHWVPAIAAAGIAGVIVGGVGPAGGVIGVLMGTVIVTWLWKANRKVRRIDV